MHVSSDLGSRQVRFQMQPNSLAKMATSTARGNFASKLNAQQTNQSQGQHTQNSESKPAVKLRKAKGQLNEMTDHEMEARMMEQQMQAERMARPMPSRGI